MTKTELIALCDAARASLPSLLSADSRDRILAALPAALIAAQDKILAANDIDLTRAREKGISAAMLDRLTLTQSRIADIAASIDEVRALPDPIRCEYEDTRPNGMHITRHRVPLGVIAMVYEARPNVTVDASVLCLKSGNAVILRGGSEAIETNRAIVAVLRDALSPFGARDAVSLIEDTDRESVNILLTLRGHVDLVIPRGGAGLIRNVVDNARVPVIETGAGNCHVYVHSSADISMAVNIIINAKTQRPSVCNAAETLLCDAAIAERFLPVAAAALREKNVELRADSAVMKYIPDATPATDDDFAREYNDYILAVGVVDNVEQAVRHINKYGTRHSEAIVAEDSAAAEYFLTHVDAAALYHNASTRFTDGGVFGMGAEIGISTQKLHVRGPFAMEALTTTQYRVYGNGQVR
ncbi:MAG: glutamate-5-semialdehyde dehydrogenase [Clostridia bacterium]|nr:glutamate-5-semialdehyde dehydrogenase [Clostridia bacterium]